jgi:Putative Ig domain/Bacterial TSP3 repeat
MAMFGWLIFQPVHQAFGKYVPDRPTSWSPIWQLEYEGFDEFGNPVEVPEPASGPDTGDNDGDGLPNWHEMLLGTECGNPDSDGDGATDGDEVHTMGTDPTDADTNDNGVNDLDDWLASLPPVITSSASISAYTGASISHQFTAICGGGGYAWSVNVNGSLPAGLYASSDCLSGSVSSAGTWSFELIVVANNALSSSQIVNITISDPPPTLAITTTSPLANADRGSQYDVTLAASNGNPTYTWTVAGGSLPPGLIMSGGGQITGTPTQSGTWAFNTQVSDTTYTSASQDLSITVNDVTLPLTITTTALPDAVLGSGYSVTLSAANGAPAYSWSLVGSSSLPSGLSFGSDGVLSGSISGSPGTWSLDFRVTDSNSQTSDRSLTLNVTDVPPPPVDNDGDLLTDQFEAELSTETGIPINDSSQTSNPYGYNDWFVWYFARAYTSDVAQDADGDGLGPILEARLGTNPNDADSNDDFRPDWWEYYQAVPAYTDSTDADGDGLHAQLEQLLGTSDNSSDPICLDSDSDGITDATEWANIQYSHAAIGDTDGDGLWDGNEASVGTQARNVDTDGDHLTDSEEVIVFASYSLNPLDADSDDDQEPDFYEVPLTDTDGGGIPDVMEDFWLLDKSDATDEGWDIDGDQMTNLEEYHTGFDIRGQIYTNFDFDADGMTNVWEIAHGLNPRNPYDTAEDPDGDWWFNVEEARNQTDPHSRASSPDTPPPEPTSGLTRGTVRQWDADWDGDDVINLTELRTPSNPRAAPPPSCDCGHTGCELTGCTSSTWGAGCACHPVTPPPSCGCGHTNCALANCTSGTWGSGCLCNPVNPPLVCGCGHSGCEGAGCSSTVFGSGCACHPVDPPASCDCGHTGCEGADCTASPRGSGCSCHTAVPCSCGATTCPVASGGICPTAGTSCTCGGTTANACECIRAGNGCRCPNDTTGCGGLGTCGQFCNCFGDACPGKYAGLCSLYNPTNMSCTGCCCGHGYCSQTSCSSNSQSGCTCDYMDPPVCSCGCLVPNCSCNGTPGEQCMSCNCGQSVVSSGERENTDINGLTMVYTDSTALSAGGVLIATHEITYSTSVIPGSTVDGPVLLQMFRATTSAYRQAMGIHMTSDGFLLENDLPASVSVDSGTSGRKFRVNFSSRRTGVIIGGPNDGQSTPVTTQAGLTGLETFELFRRCTCSTGGSCIDGEDCPASTGQPPIPP